MGKTKYITSMGELSRKDNSLCFRKNGKNVYLPIENISEIYCMNEISINTKLLDFLSQNNIIIHFYKKSDRKFKKIQFYFVFIDIIRIFAS